MLGCCWSPNFLGHQKEIEKIDSCCMLKEVLSLKKKKVKMSLISACTSWAANCNSVPNVKILSQYLT